MAVVPSLTPFTIPVDALIVATDGLTDTHVPPVPEVLNVDVPFEQILVLPLIVPAFGIAETVISLCAVALVQTPVDVIV